ncbi:hypothetical protein ACFY9R_26650 [Streptomyces albidoflavus]|uniref:hypothetical protein n=1 Tax=Streptomyces albidoflavus TaxID=1886 RepID=UPI0033FC2E76
MAIVNGPNGVRAFLPDDVAASIVGDGTGEYTYAPAPDPAPEPAPKAPARRPRARKSTT